MDLSVDQIIQAIIAVFVIVSPVDKAAYFLMITKDAPRTRRAGAFKVAMAVALTLGVAAVAGKWILDAIGVKLGAFGFAGGLILLLMGIEMLSGEPTRLQADRGSRTASEEDVHAKLLVPLAMPLTAGPGSITVVITLASSSDSWAATVSTLIGVGVTVLILLLSLLLADRWFGNISEQSTRIMTRFGGLALATIGVQLGFNGIKMFFGI